MKVNRLEYETACEVPNGQNKLTSLNLEVELDKQTIFQWRDRFIHFTEEQEIESVSLELIPHLDAPPKITIKTKIHYRK